METQNIFNINDRVIVDNDYKKIIPFDVLVRLKKAKFGIVNKICTGTNYIIIDWYDKNGVRIPSYRLENLLHTTYLTKYNIVTPFKT